MGRSETSGQSPKEWDAWEPLNVRSRREIINTREGDGRELPRVVGLCQNLAHADEFYLPDPKPGEVCPWCDLKLIHYKRTTYRLEQG